MDNNADNSAAHKRFTRSKTGCMTCRTRKLKCDETTPVCIRCSKAKLKCGWSPPVEPAHRTRKVISASGSTPLKRLAPLAAATASASASAASTPSSPCSSQSVSSDHTTYLSFSSAASSSLPPSHERALQLFPALHLQDAPPVLSPEHIPLSNSLRLTPQDQEAFLFVRNSLMVLRFGKPFQWSSLSYVYHKTASKYAGVMRIFIAGAFMELRSQALLDTRDDIVSSGQPDRVQELEHSATSHYHLALKDLSALIKHISASRGSNDDDVDALFAMWFLILHFGLYDSHSIGACSVHLQGIRTFLKPYLNSAQEQDNLRLPLLSQQLLYYISFMDIYLALDNSSSNSNSSRYDGRLWMDLLSEDVDSQVSYDTLFFSARSCLPKLWGNRYPASELLDDMENYRPLHFLHLCQKPKLDIFNLTTPSSLVQNDEKSREQLWKEITKLGDAFSDVLALANKAPDSGGKRMIYTVYHASLEFYALKVLFSCLDPGDKYPAWLDQVVATATNIGHKAISEEPRQVYRLVWPLTISMIRTRDVIHRNWLKAQVLRAQTLLPSFGILSSNWGDSGLLGELLREAESACHAVVTTTTEADDPSLVEP